MKKNHPRIHRPIDFVLMIIAWNPINSLLQKVSQSLFPFILLLFTYSRDVNICNNKLKIDLCLSLQRWCKSRSLFLLQNLNCLQVDK